ncbi:PTS sugar transporter subunit IIA [Companilactobacillus kimchii]|uniref:N-acetylglucosamine and glucose PTS, EIICBA n=2 Tax=Companilactobacillus kimchii TaxID=2801452 RepID=A0ABR5NVU9_9LACO|nr:PTS glucose transporter subunit IIA [Companilactobacillus kimchii]KRK52987.1 N-acetylglucosamine and glucose PTS, EIICBA [Companilactobacillus kimchii DSM 13961 = JCM 10707]OWF32123.1 Protein-N(pi)-phosphohistidine--sugar phosphotransferase [Companilactobacillus kimchii]GEO47930.1 PTS glucose transporter subunit IIABC [Companilactobacillus paralimentarius]
MSLFGFGQRKIIFTTPVSGQFQFLEDIEDEVFSKKLMGEGYGVIPDDNKIYSPVSGTINSIFETKHALGITTDNGLEILVHMGLDTVELNGEPFNIMVKKGEKVDNSTQLAEMDINAIKSKSYGTVVLTIITNVQEKVKNLNFLMKKSENVDVGHEILEVKIN